MENPQITKLEESIPSNSVKIIELYNKIDSGLLNTQPNYQRKLVWKKQHKYAFIDTILNNYPFPEVYIASSEMDVEKMIAAEVVVDGQQRLTTIVDYIKGTGDFKEQKKVPPFIQLSPNEKKDFLNYKVSVKDLKEIGEPLIREIFQRINSTEFSLNAVEKNNAQYGDGEIALFCKQIVDEDYTATENETDIVLSPDVKKELNDFFKKNKVFSDNDKRRMYNFQYAILLVSTILEGNYYGRSVKVDEYLETYNTSFENNQIALDLLTKSIQAMTKMDFSEKSYWYNKANLFTMIVELAKVDTDRIDYEKLESELLELENKVDRYFLAEDEGEIADITEDERKYFEYARHGSHEKATREHRGKVISKILQGCIIDKEDKHEEGLEQLNHKVLKGYGIEYTIIIPTETGLSKSLMDATLPVRNYLKEKNIHDYSIQENGPEFKVTKPANYILKDKLEELKISLYRATKRGDARIWLSDLNHNADALDLIGIIVKEDKIFIINLSKLNLSELIETDNPFKNNLL
nr:DUF262 domain-containing protein [uncultured Draconibacterium sp.]